MTQIIFYIFGAMLLLSATMVVVIKNPIHADNSSIAPKM
jgi:NADH:ubiquinone oxidoreductase subunit 6 (subunit J)